MARERTGRNTSVGSGPPRASDRLGDDARRDRQLLEAHIENSPLAFIEFDPELRFTRWAGAAERMFGYSAEEVLGRSIGEMRWVYEEDLPLVGELTARLYGGVEARGVNVNRNYRKDGSVIWCEWYNSAIRDEDGELVSVLSAALDITERKEAEETAGRELENTHVLLDAAAALASGRSLGEVLEAFCDALLVTIPHKRVIVSLWDETRSCIVTAASKGQDPVTLGECLPIDTMTAPGRRVLETRRSAVIDYDALPAPIDPPPQRRPSHLALAVPLAYGDRLVGLFTIDDPDERLGFTAREIQMAEGIASQASIAIEHARLYDAERERMRLADALAAVELAMHASLEWQDIAATALAETALAIGADCALMVAQEGDEFVVWMDFGFEPSILGRRFRGERYHEVMEAQRRGTIAVDDMHADERFAEGLAGREERSLIAAPLVVRGEIVAAVSLMYRGEQHHFTSAEVQAVTRVASGLSLALENARLYATERALADRLQEAMLTMPDHLDGIEFAHAYHSAEEEARVGGDFYDLFEVGHGVVGITIGDVAGKGLAAAVLTSLAKNTIRAHASEAGKTPAEVLALTNEVVLLATPAESFVTVFFGLLDRLDGSLTYASAGHMPGVLSHPDGKTDALPPTGMVLGALPGVPFGQSEVRLAPDDLLFLYTDGLTEARRDGVQYGEGRVFAMLSGGDRSPLEVCRRVADDVLGYTGHRLGDDLALLAVKRLREQQEAPPSAGLEV